MIRHETLKQKISNFFDFTKKKKKSNFLLKILTQTHLLVMKKKTVRSKQKSVKKNQSKILN